MGPGVYPQLCTSTYCQEGKTELPSLVPLNGSSVFHQRITSGLVRLTLINANLGHVSNFIIPPLVNYLVVLYLLKRRGEIIKKYPRIKKAFDGEDLPRLQLL